MEAVSILERMMLCYQWHAVTVALYGFVRGGCGARVSDANDQWRVQLQRAEAAGRRCRMHWQMVESGVRCLW